MNLSRRQWLAGAAAGLTATSLARNTFAAPTSRLDYIDIHSHIYSGEMSQVTGVDSLDPANLPKTVKFTLDEMDKAGVPMSLFSVGTESYFREPDAAGKARRFNENFARIVSDHPTRFRFFACLPFPNIDATLKEIDYATNKLGAVGVHMYASNGAKWMGDPIYAPVFEELNRRKAVIKTHPVPNDCCKVAGFGVTENGFDTMRAITKMLESGSSSRYPDIKIIWSHAGGALLGLVQRFVGEFEDNPKLAEIMPHGPEYELRRFYYDTAQSTNPIVMQALKSLVGASQIVFGSDYPYSTIADHANALRKCGFTEAELRGIDRENALKILPKY